MAGLTRRAIAAALAALPAACDRQATLRVREHREASIRFALDKIKTTEADATSRFGVFALNPATGDTLAHRADERFALCSSFKWLLGAAVLARVDTNEDSLDRSFDIEPDDKLGWSPVIEAALNQGKSEMTLAQLCAASAGQSDNGASNIILRHLGGPEAFTRIVRAMGDEDTRLDRYELALNHNDPAEPRDTTTPRAMATTLDRVAFGDVLSSSSQEQLQSWMEAANTGLDRLRAGFPKGWRAGDKTGASGTGAYNDVGYCVGPDGQRLVIACYLNTPDMDVATSRLIHALIAQIASDALLDGAFGHTTRT